MDDLGSSMPLGGGDQKSIVMNRVRQEAAMTNARQLIEKVNEHCFDKCVPKPGTSLSSGETTCFTQCMEKYMAAWNTVSRQYITRIQQESGKAPGNGGMF
ncbi:Tim10-like protein [Glarea lozoyensis ATCC 20868]|uniref:Mitochondrial import inner membrane translocase subunit n=1 Tax=Glarea lozoyensis (strain ATCC 20868 / MF5171) TaxID=1116229 RepID=S3D4G3_GLAL2|nr:Tim10-like protein [Glarea lozoyensis ATCC 20868]EPE32695.1 Tim10-like protein [Glarea lozoyensis ATCC 20868]